MLIVILEKETTVKLRDVFGIKKFARQLEF